MIVGKMRALALTGLVVLTIPAASTTARAAGRPVDWVAAFAGRKQVDVELSPDGRLLAWRQLSGAQAEVVIFDLATRAVLRRVTVSPTTRIRSLSWAGPGTLLLTTSDLQHIQQGKEHPLTQFRQYLAVDVASGHMCKLPGTRLIAWNGGAPDTLIVSAWHLYIHSEAWPMRPSAPGDAPESFSAVSLFRFDARTCKTQEVGRDDGYTIQWVVGAQDDPVARLEYQPQEKRYYILARRGRHDWQQIYQHIGGEVRVGGLTEAGRAVLAIVRQPDGRGRLWSIPLDQSPPKALLPTANQNVFGFYRSRRSGRTLGVWIGDTGRHVHWLDQAAKMRYNSLARLFPARHVRVYDPSTDGREVLVEVQGPSSPPMYYLVNFTTHRADIAGETYPQLEHVPLGKVSRMQYRSPGGQSIQANLILPPGAAGKSLPLVVLVPGGPSGDSPFDFDWLGQFLALNGYAVLRPEVLRAGPGRDSDTPWRPTIEWGRTSLDYAVEGVRELVKQGVVDPRRVCIVGSGYGGYAALAGVAFTPHLYTCAVSINGISDLPSFLAYQHGQLTGSPVYVEDCAWWGCPYWTMALGSENLAADSPVTAVERIVAPVLLIYSQDDPYVPESQSVDMDSALSKLGKPVTLVKLGSWDHWLSEPATRTEVLQTLEEFLAKHLS